MDIQNWGFCDLSVKKCFDLNKLSVLEKFGFNTIAINTVVEESIDEPKKKKKKGEQKQEKIEFIPAPIEIPQEIKDTCKLNILQRITLECSDTSISHKINQSENIKKYDILAVIPKTLQAFQHACGSLDVDIIAFEIENKVPFRINRKLYTQAADRGIHFEVMYSSAIDNSLARRNIISTAHTLHAVGKSRNIIVTSGAPCERLVRSVYDVINLGFILGLNINQTLQVIRDNAQKVILKAQSRRCGKHYMTVSMVDQLQNKTDNQ